MGPDDPNLVKSVAKLLTDRRVVWRRTCTGHKVWVRGHPVLVDLVFIDSLYALWRRLGSFLDYQAAATHFQNLVPTTILPFAQIFLRHARHWHDHNVSTIPQYMQISTNYMQVSPQVSACLLEGRRTKSRIVAGIYIKPSFNAPPPLQRRELCMCVCTPSETSHPRRSHFNLPHAALWPVVTHDNVEWICP